MDEDEGRALLAAYLPAAEPPETTVTEVVTRAKAVRRRRRTVLVGAASVIVVLVATGVGLGSLRADGPPAAPGPTAPLSPSHPPSPRPCHDFLDQGDAGARAWARWVRGKLGPQAEFWDGWFSRTCAEKKDSGFVPTRTQNQAEFRFSTRPRPGEVVTDPQHITALAVRWERLPDTAGRPCQDIGGVEFVVCEQSTLADGSLVVRQDYSQVVNQRANQTVRHVARIFPDGRVLGLTLDYSGPPAEGFARMVRTLDELTAIVVDPAALRYFPRP